MATSAAQLAEFDADVQRHPADPTAYNNRAFSFFDLGRVDDALRDFSTAIELERKSGQPSAITFFNRGAVYMRQSNYQAAIADFNAAIQLNPNYAKAYAQRGLAHSKLGNTDASISDYGKAIELDRKK